MFAGAGGEKVHSRWNRSPWSSRQTLGESSAHQLEVGVLTIHELCGENLETHNQLRIRHSRLTSQLKVIRLRRLTSRTKIILRSTITLPRPASPL